MGSFFCLMFFLIFLRRFAKLKTSINFKINYMGKGDKKTRRGKITMGTYGKTRPRKKKKKSTAAKRIAETETPVVATSAEEKKEVKAPKKTAAKKSTKKSEEQ